MGEQLVNRRVRSDPSLVFERFMVLEVSPGTEDTTPQIIRNVDARVFGKDGGMGMEIGADWDMVYKEWESSLNEEKNVPVQGVEMFCFPFLSNKQYISYRDDDAFVFVLTDSEGWQQFGFCLHQEWANGGGFNNSYRSKYMPNSGAPFPQFNQPRTSKLFCFCFLSYLPWFGFFSRLLKITVNLNFGESGSLLPTEFVALLRRIYLKKSLPEPGTLFRVPVSVGLKFESRIPFDPTLKYTPIPDNENLATLLTKLSTFNIMNIFAALLLERRILVTSSKLSILTKCVNGLTSLLYPLYWQHIFIPIMPFSLSDYCSAPMPYLIGIHRSVLSHVQTLHLEEVIMVDLDKDEVLTPFNDLKILPRALVIPLFDTLKLYEKSNALSAGEQVQKAFLRFFVNLFGSYRHFFSWKRDEEQEPVGEKYGCSKAHMNSVNVLDMDPSSLSNKTGATLRNESLGGRLAYSCDVGSLVLSKPSNWKPFVEVFFNLQMFQQLVVERIHYNSESKTNIEDISAQLNFLMGKKSIWEEALDEFDSNESNNLEYSGDSHTEHVWDRLVSYADMKSNANRRYSSESNSSVTRGAASDSSEKKPAGSKKITVGRFFASRKKNYAAVSLVEGNDCYTDNDDYRESSSYDSKKSIHGGFSKGIDNPYEPSFSANEGANRHVIGETTGAVKVAKSAKSMQLIDLDFDAPLFTESEERQTFRKPQSIDEIFSLQSSENFPSSDNNLLFSQVPKSSSPNYQKQETSKDALMANRQQLGGTLSQQNSLGSSFSMSDSHTSSFSTSLANYNRQVTVSNSDAAFAPNHHKFSAQGSYPSAPLQPTVRDTAGLSASPSNSEERSLSKKDIASFDPLNC
eukprot:Nk52_evm6s1224 gene=Nk52_evmTU6s1224